MSFHSGDIVAMATQPNLSDSWTGQKFRVLKGNINDPDRYTRLLPLEDRPDGFGRAELLWTTTNLEKW